jgi:hypothetical protein
MFLVNDCTAENKTETNFSFKPKLGKYSKSPYSVHTMRSKFDHFPLPFRKGTNQRDLFVTSFLVLFLREQYVEMSRCYFEFCQIFSELLN